MIPLGLNESDIQPQFRDFLVVQWLRLRLSPALRGSLVRNIDPGIQQLKEKRSCVLTRKRVSRSGLAANLKT